jgi:hypothetical protein
MEHLRMSKLTIPALAAFLIGAAAASTAQAEPPTLNVLIKECRVEASRALEEIWRTQPSLRGAIEAHRDLMATACVRWQSAEKTDVLLAQCLDQVAEGQRLLARDGSTVDPAHIERQNELCRRLAAQRS